LSFSTFGSWQQVPSSLGFHPINFHHTIINQNPIPPPLFFSPTIFFFSLSYNFFIKFCLSLSCNIFLSFHLFLNYTLYLSFHLSLNFHLLKSCNLSLNCASFISF
jgi:hypothetical protein